MQLRNSRILITGGNRGIGKAVAMEAARRGASVLLANRTADPGLLAELKSLTAAPVQELKVDLTDRKSIERLCQTPDFSEIDILFNNAGQLTGGLLENQSLDDIYSMIQVNMTALVHLTHQTIPHMLRRKQGLIINHGSVSSIMHFPCASTYSAAKAGVLAFSESLRAELKNTGVEVLVLLTPGIDTRMFADIEKSYSGNMDTSFLTSVPPEEYAIRVCDAIDRGDWQLWPTGATGLALHLARHAPRLFAKLAGSKFKR